MSSSAEQLPASDKAVHETAVIDPSVRLGEGVSVGPYSIIGADVEIGDATRIGPHVVIRGRTRIGRNNRVYQFVSLGDEPQDKKYGGESSELIIGDGNTIREYCTINRGTVDGGGKTVIGDRNWIMAYVHVAHDCIVGNRTVFVNGAAIAGHVEVHDDATLSAFALVHQFCRVGRYAFVAPTTVLTKDLTPFTLASGSTGSRARTYSLNEEGLRRRGFNADLVEALRYCYRRRVRGVPPDKDDEGDKVAELAKRYPEVEEFIRFIDNPSRRGILR